MYYFTPLPGYFSPFPHGTRPLSVTRKYLGLPGGPGRFTADYRGPPLLGNTNRKAMNFRLPGSHRLRPAIPHCSTNPRLDNSPHACQHVHVAPTTPTTQPLTGITRHRFSLIRFRSPLLTESLLFSLPTGTEMFHFPAFPPHTLYIQVRVTPHHGCWVSPFGHPRISARLTAPRGLSRPPTSF